MHHSVRLTSRMLVPTASASFELTCSICDVILLAALWSGMPQYPPSHAPGPLARSRCRKLEPREKSLGSVSSGDLMVPTGKVDYLINSLRTLHQIREQQIRQQKPQDVARHFLIKR